MTNSETYKLKQIGSFEYYIGKFKSPEGHIQYGVHARYIDTKKPILQPLFDTPDEAEAAFIKWVEKQ